VKAGWNISDRMEIAFEIPVAGYYCSVPEGFTSHCLYIEKSGQKEHRPLSRGLHG
jgi:hypothetical protein